MGVSELVCPSMRIEGYVALELPLLAGIVPASLNVSGALLHFEYLSQIHHQDGHDGHLAPFSWTDAHRCDDRLGVYASHTVFGEGKERILLAFKS